MRKKAYCIFAEQNHKDQAAAREADLFTHIEIDVHNEGEVRVFEEMCNCMINECVTPVTIEEWDETIGDRHDTIPNLLSVL